MVSNKKNKYPFISIIMPCRNEEMMIGKSIASIVGQTYPKERMELLIIDGMSDNQTLNVIKKYVEKFSFIRFLKNPKKITPVAFNLGIQNSKGDLIVIIGAHNVYDQSYIARSIKYLDKYQADNVGGIWKIVPRKNTLMGRSIALALASVLGAGNSFYKKGYSKGPKWVDTVFGGCYRKEVFKKIGLFNEKLIKGQDKELNLRLRKAGGKVLLHPRIISYYHARSDLKSFLKYNFKNGFWIIYGLRFTNYLPLAPRHIMPFLFVLTLFIIFFLSLFFASLWLMFFFIISLYFSAIVVFSILAIIQTRNLVYFLSLPFVFVILHIGYGLGSFWGLINLFMPFEQIRNRLISA